MIIAAVRFRSPKNRAGDESRQFGYRDRKFLRADQTAAPSLGTRRDEIVDPELLRPVFHLTHTLRSGRETFQRQQLTSASAATRLGLIAMGDRADGRAGVPTTNRVF
jgi:hypothetical protein